MKNSELVKAILEIYRIINHPFKEASGIKEDITKVLDKLIKSSDKG